MNLESDAKRKNIQLRLDFSSTPTAIRSEGIRRHRIAPGGVHEPERPANTISESWRTGERANLKVKLLRRHRSNKGSAGVDGMTVDKLGDYLKQHWPVNKQLLSGTRETETGEAGGNLVDGGGGCESLASRPCWTALSSKR